MVRVLGRLAPSEPAALRQLLALANKGTAIHRSPRMQLLTVLKVCARQCACNYVGMTVCR